MANRHSSTSRRRLDPTPHLDIWQRLTRVLAISVLMIGAAVGFLYLLPEKEMLDEMVATNERLTQRRDQLLVEKTQKLRLEREGLADPAYLEVIARDRLNMQLPGETVIRIERDDFLR